MNRTRQIADSISDARALLHAAGVADKEASRKSDTFGADHEPDQREVSADDIERVVERWKADAAGIRAFVAKHGVGWTEMTRQRWLVRAEELDWMHSEHNSCR